MFERFRLTKKNKVLFLTGAGASQESNIPTFRDSNGLWRNYDPKLLACASALYNDPLTVNQFYNERRKLLSTVEPNYFHYFITIMQEKYGLDRIGIITTNVDDLHERAGNQDVLHLHGHLTEIIREKNNIKKVFNIGYNAVNNEDIINYNVRPNVVMFEEGAYFKNDKQYNAYNDMDKIISSLKKNDIVFVVGCSNSVVNFPLEVYENTIGVKLFTINPNFTEKDSYVSEYKNIKMTACNAVPYIEDLIMENING